MDQPTIQTTNRLKAARSIQTLPSALQSVSCSPSPTTSDKWVRVSMKQVSHSKALDSFNLCRLRTEKWIVLFCLCPFLQGTNALNEIITQCLIKCYSLRLQTDTPFGLMILHYCQVKDGITSVYIPCNMTIKIECNLQIKGHGETKMRYIQIVTQILKRC